MRRKISVFLLLVLWLAVLVLPAQAAELGYAKAQNALGRMYYEGEAVEKDWQQARTWLGLAANQGHIESADFINAHLIDLPKTDEKNAPG